VDLGRSLRATAWLRPFPDPPVPCIVRHKFIPPWIRSPPEFLTSSQPSDLSAGAASHGVFGSLQRHPRASPMRNGLSPTIPVPLSGFLNLTAVSRQARVPRPCFVPQPFLKAPLQSLSLTRIVNLSRGHLLPRGYPPACRTYRSRPCCRRFHQTPTMTQLPGSPGGYGLPFDRPKPVSRLLWISNGRAALSTSFTRLEVLLPL
jgi:hypothetical protein